VGWFFRKLLMGPAGWGCRGIYTTRRDASIFQGFLKSILLNYSQMSINLSILIPTWDRPEKVKSRLREIWNEFGSTASVHIQVNPGKYSKNNIDISSYPGPIKVCENIANIGFVANIITGLTNINNCWIWILGDDDPILPGSREIIFQAISKANHLFADAIIFNHWHESSKLNKDPSDLIVSSFSQLLSYTGFSDILFISGCIWKSTYLNSNIGLLVDYSFTRASQAVIHIAGLLENNSSLLVIDEPIVIIHPEIRWSRIDFLDRIFKIFYHPSLQSNSKQVYPFVAKQAMWALHSSLSEFSSLPQVVSIWAPRVINYLTKSLILGGAVVFMRQLFGVLRLMLYIIKSKL